MQAILLAFICIRLFLLGSGLLGPTWAGLAKASPEGGEAQGAVLLSGAGLSSGFGGAAVGPGLAF
jgi:hypothetical protein